MKLTLVIACLLIGWRGTTAQGLTRIAGVGIGGYNGDNKPATSAELNNTTGLVKDKAGNIYISEAGNERVRKINTSGIITTIAGNGSAGYTGDNGQAVYATLSSPCALAIDSAGNLYVADQGNGVIRRIDTFGIITTIVTGVSAPSGLAFDKAGNLYIAEQTGYVITRVDPQGNQTTVAGTGTSGDSGDFGSALLADISSPYGITVDATGNIFFTELSGYVRKVDNTGIITTIAGNGYGGYNGDGIKATLAGLSSPEGVAIDARNLLYIADGSDDRIRVIDNTGTIYTYVGPGGTVNANLGFETALYFDATGNLYIVDGGTNYVYEVRTSNRPVAGFSASTNSVCSGNSVIFTNQSTNATGYQWVFNGGVPATSNQMNPSAVVYSTPGVYPVQLIATNGNGSDTLLQSSYITVTPQPAAGTIRAPTSACAGSNVQLSDSGSVGVRFWQSSADGLSFSPGVPVDTASTLSLAAVSQSAYYRVVSVNGCGVDSSQPVYLTVVPVPVAGFITSPSSACAGSTVQLSDSGSTGSLQWQSSPDGLSFNSLSGDTIPVLSLPGIKNSSYYRMAAFNSCGLDSSAPVRLIVNPLPVAGAIATPAPVCAGAAVQMSDSGSVGSLQWQSSPDGLSFASLSGDTLAALSLPGVQQSAYYRALAANSCGLDSSAPVQLAVRPLPTPALVTSDSLLCSGDSTRVCTGNTFASYRWNTGDTVSCTTAFNAGGYWLTVTDNNHCSAVSGHQNINYYPVPSVSIIRQGDTLSSFGQVTYQWIRNGVPVDKATSSVFVATESGLYALQVTDVNGCTTTSEAITVTVNTGLLNLSAEDAIHIYPNPSAGAWQLAVDNSLVGGILEVYDEQGRIVFHSKIETQNSKLEPEVADGIYLVRIRSNEINYSHTIIKQSR